MFIVLLDWLELNLDTFHKYIDLKVLFETLVPFPTLQWPGQNGGNEAIRFKRRQARKTKSFLMSKLSAVCGTLSIIYGSPNNIGGSLLHKSL